MRGHLVRFLHRVALCFSSPFLDPKPRAFQTLEISRVSWSPFRLSKNSFSIREFRCQGLSVLPLPKALLNSPIFASPRVLLISKNLFITTRPFSDFRNLFQPLRALSLFPKILLCAPRALWDPKMSVGLRALSYLTNIVSPPPSSKSPVPPGSLLMTLKGRFKHSQFFSDLNPSELLNSSLALPMPF